MIIYITLGYAIKYSDTRFLCHIIKEIYLIFYIPIIYKQKYAYVMMKHLYIIDIKSVNPILQEIHIANTLIDFHSQSFMFYEIDLLLKYHNGKYKYFCSDRK